MLNKGALSLLSVYGDDSSDDDDVPGPGVSTKRTNKFDLEDSPEGPTKRPKRLPVPEALLGGTLIDIHTDDPSLHGGRIRSFAHERGNWVTFIYIPFADEDNVQQLISNAIVALPLNNMDLRPCDDFHISLTRTVVLKHHWIEPFVDDVKSNTSNYRKFMILFDGLKVFCNEERTRTFLGFETRTGFDSLMMLVEVLDKCLAEFNLQPFYKDPKFHMSIAWCVGDREDELNRLLPQISHELHLEVDNLSIYVESLSCKTGNKHYRFSLR